MPEEISGNISIPMTLQGPLTDEALARFLLPHADMTYRRLQDLNISGADLYQSLLTGSFIRSCTFTEVRFQRADLDGVRIEGSIFISCDFSGCDFRSSHFSRCRFDDCIFSEAFISDCEFHECIWSNGNFTAASFTESRLYDSSMIACVMSQGTFIHNRLQQCTLTDMVIGDCTFLYVIVRDCKFEKVTINADSIGAVLGLTREQVAAANLMFLGKQEKLPPGADLIGLLSEEYRQRQWYIGQLGLALNFRLSSTIGAFQTYLTSSYDRFAEMGFAKGDEIQFIVDILEELAAMERLPLLTAMDVLRWCSQLGGEFTKENRKLSETSNRSIKVLANRTSLICNELFDRLESSVAEIQFSENEIPVYLKVTFNERPRIELEELLNSISKASSLSIQQRALLISTETGSYVAIIYTTLFTVFAFKMFLFLINGCLIQLTEMKHRLKVLARKQAPKNYADLVLTPTQPISPPVLLALQGLMKYAKNLQWIEDPALLGFEASNIRAMQIIDKAQPDNK